ncbi:hypothetical protein GQ44DRAFT_743684 [Phaeosphaeriaceae sp. PMI808]|nr:hypothetical protein GQ44DRAFT_743684 [Phaeosphaeriaceae sp. PMI808]
MDIVATLQARDRLYDKSGELNRITTVLLVLATLFVCLRFWARYISLARYGADDWLIVAALVFVFTLGALNYAAISYGLGRHADTVLIDDLVTFFKILLAFECIYITAVLLVKLSLLLMYRRLFLVREFKIYLAILAAICNLISKAWLPWIEGTCINLKASFIGNAILNILTDVAILCMPFRPRLSLCFIFLLGSFVLFASIYCFTTLMQFDPSDTTWILAQACTWCVVEVACGVISACLLTLRPLMVKISHRFGGLTNSKATELVTIGGTNWSKPREKHF